MQRNCLTRKPDFMPPAKTFDDFLECILDNMWKDKHENRSVDLDSVDDDDEA